MLLLNSAQVEYCNVTCPGAAPAETLTGIIYQDKPFVQGESFPQAERKTAIEHCQQKLDQNVMCLLTEDTTGFTVWYEDKALELIKPSERDSTASNLENLVLAMQESEEINVKDRWRNLKPSPQCFVGSEAVAWLMRTQNISREAALNLGEQLIQAGLIRSVDQQPFRDGPCFYQFSSKVSSNHQSFQLTRNSTDKHQSFRLTL